MKLIKPLENREILLKETVRKITSQKGGFLNFLRPLITAGLPLMKNVLTPLAKSILILLGLTAAASAADAAIQRKIQGSGKTALIISNEEMEEAMEIVNAEMVTYFDSFGVEYIPKEIRNFIGVKIL